jgi:hypothetical protein
LDDQANQELIKSLEMKISELSLVVNKQERDIAYKDEEIRSLKNIARDVAEYVAFFRFIIIRTESLTLCSSSKPILRV